MKFSTSKNELQNALQKLSKATPSRATLPILNSVLIDVGEESTTIKSTDLEITVIVKLAASIESVGSVAAPLQMLLNILMNCLTMPRIIFMLLRILLKLKFLAYLQVQNVMIQF